MNEDENKDTKVFADSGIKIADDTDFIPSEVVYVDEEGNIIEEQKKVQHSDFDFTHIIIGALTIFLIVCVIVLITR